MYVRIRGARARARVFDEPINRGEGPRTRVAVMRGAGGRIEVRSDVSAGTADVTDVTCSRGCCCPGHTHARAGHAQLRGGQGVRRGRHPTVVPFFNPRALRPRYAAASTRVSTRVAAAVRYDTSACPTYNTHNNIARAPPPGPDGTRTYVRFVYTNII